jgi:hypothetical protein
VTGKGHYYYYYYYYYYYEGGEIRKVHCSKGSQTVPARPSVELGCRHGGSVMASGLLGCAEGKQVEFNFVFGGQRYGKILVISVWLHDQHALQSGFTVGLRKTTECLGGAGRPQDLPNAG